MTIRYSKRFRKLPAKVQQQFERRLKLFLTDPITYMPEVGNIQTA